MRFGSNSSAIVTGRGAKTLLASSVLARLPLAMFGIALLVHAQQLTGSFGSAGLVTGAYALCSAASAPALGRLVDRYAQTRVLVACATMTALALVIIGVLPRSAPPALLIILGGATGLATPPLAACVRTLAPAIVAEPDGLPALFAFESTVLELTFILGPPLALGLGELWSTGTALAVSGGMMLAGTLVFAAQPASRHWRPETAATRPPGGALRTPAMRTLVLILFATGAVFGATEVGVTSATHALGSTATTGLLLGIWGLGSLLGGIVTTRLGGGARSARGLVLLLGALALVHGALMLATGSVVEIGATILLAGATVAPTLSSIYMLVDSAAPAGTQTEAFSWLVTASLTGSAIGACVGGALARSGGAQAVFALVGAAGGLGALVAVVRSSTLEAVARRPDRSPTSRLRAGCSDSPPAPSVVGEIGSERWISRTDRLSTGNRSECARDRSESTNDSSSPFPTKPLEV
ncbi:MAG: MFS transporter [Solirubrobacteraceae bacterium]